MATLNADAVTLCPLVNPALVREIIETDLTDPQINNFINMAYFQVLRLVGHLGSCGGGDAVCQIMQVLAAHFITMIERQTKSESVAGEWTVAFLGQDGLGLDASLYGQQAKSLDCSGILAKAGLKQASFEVTSYRDLEASTYDIDRTD